MVFIPSIYYPPPHIIEIPNRSFKFNKKPRNFHTPGTQICSLFHGLSSHFLPADLHRKSSMAETHVSGEAPSEADLKQGVQGRCFIWRMIPGSTLGREAEEEKQPMRAV